MNLKKSDKANLEKKKTIYFEIGLIFALAAVLISFEWKFDSADKTGFDSQIAQEQIDEEIIPVTLVEQRQPAPPRPPQESDLLNIVDDDVDLDEEFEIIDAEDYSENKHIDTDFDYANYDGEYADDDEPFVVAEHMPVFPYGDAAAWLQKNAKYPAVAESNGIQGKVIMKFVIERDGSVSNIEILRGVDPSLDKEALRVVQSMPKWKPGRQRDKPVRVSYTVPISFYLQ